MRINGWLRRVPILPLYAVALVPALWLFWLGVGNQLGADPVKTLERELGEIGLQFLIASLCVTPLLRLTRVNLCRFRRMLGLTAFYYLCLHFLTWVALDLQLNWSQIGADLTKRPYIVVGAAALLLLLPLAVTSNDLALRRMGSAAWRRLHRLVYVAAILAALHVVWQAKTVGLEVAIYAGLIFTLLIARLKTYRLLRQSAETRSI